MREVRGKRQHGGHAEQKSFGGKAAAFGQAEGRDFRLRAVSGERERACVKYAESDSTAGTPNKNHSAAEPPPSGKPKDVIFAFAQFGLAGTGVREVRERRLLGGHAEQKSFGGKAAAFGRTEGRDFRHRAVSGERACVKYAESDSTAGTPNKNHSAAEPPPSGKPKGVIFAFAQFQANGSGRA